MPQFQSNCRVEHARRRKSPELRIVMKHIGLGCLLESFALIPPSPFSAMGTLHLQDPTSFPRRASFPSLTLLSPLSKDHLSSGHATLHHFVLNTPTFAKPVVPTHYKQWQ